MSDAPDTPNDLSGHGFVPTLPRPNYSILAADDPETATNRPGFRVDECLAVGRGVIIRGKIEKCENIFVEGTIEADFEQCRTLEIAESGLVVGKVSTAVAVIDGHFQGELTASDHLRITETGRLTGRAGYAQLEILPGGVIDGELYCLPPAPDTSMPDPA